jgi:hypothetical protein
LRITWPETKKGMHDLDQKKTGRLHIEGVNLHPGMIHRLHRNMYHQNCSKRMDSRQPFSAGRGQGRMQISASIGSSCGANHQQMPGNG